MGTWKDCWSKPTQKVSTLRSRKASPMDAISGATSERPRKWRNTMPYEASDTATTTTTPAAEPARSDPVHPCTATPA